MTTFQPSPRPVSPPPAPPQPPADPPIGPGPRAARSARRRQRLVHVLNRSGWYLVAYAIVGASLLWLADVHLIVPGMAVAAMVSNPWRPKRPARPTWVGSGMRAFHAGLQRFALALTGAPPGHTDPLA